MGKTVVVLFVFVVDSYYVFIIIKARTGFLLLLVLFCCAVTLHHVVTISTNKNTKEINQNYNSIIGSFSIIRSTLELIKYDKNNELNSINGLKFIMMLSLLFGHTFLYIAGSPLSYPKAFENIYIHGPDMILTNSNVVDPFFFISGFLMYLTVAPVFRKSGSFWIKFASPIVYRVVRMLPAYCAVMAFTAHIMPHLGNGPFWHQKSWQEAEKCKSYWWTNVLFISNFVDAKYQCLLVSWYISCDIQFFIIGVFILYIYIKNKKRGIVLLVTTFIVSFIIPFVVTYWTKADGLLKLFIPFLEDPRSSTTFDKIYRPGYMRAFPFFAGFGCILIVEKLKENKFKFSKIIAYFGTLIVGMFCMWIQLYGILFYQKDRLYNPLEHALYASLSHFSWTGPIFWIVLVLYTTGYGALTKIFNNRLVVILGRLSYSVFLVNLVVILISQCSQRLTTYSSMQVLMDSWIYDSFKSYLMAALLYLVVEAPFGNVARIIFGRGPKKDMLNVNEINIEDEYRSQNELNNCLEPNKFCKEIME